MSPPPARAPPAPHRPPLLTLSPGAAGGGGRGSGIQRPAPRWGAGGGKGREGTTPEGLGGPLICPTASLSPAWGGGARGYFWAAVPHLAPGGSLAGSGAEQAGGIFILEQHCRGGWLGELSVTAAAERTRAGCQNSPRARGAGPGSPGGTAAPGRDRLPPGGGFGSPLLTLQVPPSPCSKGRYH